MNIIIHLMSRLSQKNTRGTQESNGRPFISLDIVQNIQYLEKKHYIGNPL